MYLFNLIGTEQKQFIKSVLYELYNAQANFTAEQNEISYSLQKKQYQPAQFLRKLLTESAFTLTTRFFF